MSGSLFDLQFDNRFIRDRPVIQEKSNYRRQVVDACYSFVEPTPFRPRC